MALVSLKNGKVIDVDLNWYLNLSDEELQDLEATYSGFDPDNPFYNSSLSRGPAYEKGDIEEDEEFDEGLEEDMDLDFPTEEE